MQPCQNIVALPCFLPPSLTLILNQNKQDCSKRRKTFSAQNAQSVINMFLLTCSAAKHIYCNKRKCLPMKRVQLSQYKFTTPTWRTQRHMKKVSEASCLQMVERDLMVPTTGEKRSSRHMRGGNNHVHDFWQTHWLRGEIPVVELKKKNDRQISQQQCNYFGGNLQ